MKTKLRKSIMGVLGIAGKWHKFSWGVNSIKAKVIFLGGTTGYKLNCEKCHTEPRYVHPNLIILHVIATCACTP